MQDINVQMKQRNATNTDWDNLYPKTKAIVVIDSDGNTVESHMDDTTKHITGAERTAWSAKQASLGFTPENIANKGAANGYASIGSDGKIPSAQLPAIALTTADITEGTNKYYTEARVSANTDVASNTAHRGSAHAPSTAQKNSDITKAEIEAKLIGVISSHSHASGTPTAHKATHLSGGSDAMITISSTAPTTTLANELFFEILI